MGFTASNSTSLHKSHTLILLLLLTVLSLSLCEFDIFNWKFGPCIASIFQWACSDMYYHLGVIDKQCSWKQIVLLGHTCWRSVVCPLMPCLCLGSFPLQSHESWCCCCQSSSQRLCFPLLISNCMISSIAPCLLLYNPPTASRYVLTSNVTATVSSSIFPFS